MHAHPAAISMPDYGWEIIILFLAGQSAAFSLQERRKGWMQSQARSTLDTIITRFCGGCRGTSSGSPRGADIARSETRLTLVVASFQCFPTVRILIVRLPQDTRRCMPAHHPAHHRQLQVVNGDETDRFATWHAPSRFIPGVRPFSSSGSTPRSVEAASLQV